MEINITFNISAKKSCHFFKGLKRVTTIPKSLTLESV